MLLGQSSTYFSLPGVSDPVSSLTHLFGAMVFAALTVLLVRRTECRRRRWLLCLFAAASVAQLVVSGVYHLLPHGSWQRHVMLQFDQTLIFILIASTYTPIVAILFQRWARTILLAAVWSLATGGILLQTFHGGDLPRWLTTTLYLCLGWIGAMGGRTVWLRFGEISGLYILSGGVAYTVGAAINLIGEPVVIPGVLGPHELFHVAVLVGMGIFWAYIHRIADGLEDQRAAERRFEQAAYEPARQVR